MGKSNPLTKKEVNPFRYNPLRSKQSAVINVGLYRDNGDE